MAEMPPAPQGPTSAPGSRGAPSAGRPRRLGLYLPFVLLALVFSGWTVFWFVSASLARQVSDNFIAREAERGRDWICPDRGVAGFPFRIELTCNRPQLVLRGEDGLRREGRLGALALHARILSPGHFIAVLSPPFVAREGEASAVEITWKSARASLMAGAESISAFSAEFSEPVLTAGSGDRQDIRALARNVEVHLRRSPGETPGTDLVARVDDLTFAMLDQLTGTPDPIRFELQATAAGLIADPKRRFQDVLEDWRMAGNKARVVVLQASKGPANLDLSGAMGLDQERRLEGALQGRAKGIEALTARLGRRGGLDLGGLLGRIGGNQGLPVALTFEGGRMRFGPFPLAELHPLY